MSSREHRSPQQALEQDQEHLPCLRGSIRSPSARDGRHECYAHIYSLHSHSAMPPRARTKQTIASSGMATMTNSHCHQAPPRRAGAAPPAPPPSAAAGAAPGAAPAAAAPPGAAAAAPGGPPTPCTQTAAPASSRLTRPCYLLGLPVALSVRPTQASTPANSHALADPAAGPAAGTPDVSAVPRRTLGGRRGERGTVRRLAAAHSARGCILNEGASS